MTTKTLKNLLKIGEGLTLEFKRSVSGLGREICALANTSGGKILLAALCAAACPAAEPGQPKLVCFENSYNFGTKAGTNRVTHDFLVMNEGDAPLKLLRIRTTCGGCTTVDVTSTNVPPGDYSELHVAYNLRGYSGRKTAKVYLHTNDPKCLIYELALTGNVIPVDSPKKSAHGSTGVSAPPPRSAGNGLRISPGSIVFGSVTNSAAVTNTVVVTAASGKGFRVLDADAKSSGLRASVETLEEKRKYAVHISIGAGAPAGAIDDRIRLVVKDYRIHYLHVPVRAWVVEDIAVVPKSLHISSTAEKGQQIVTVLSRSRHRFSIKGTDLPLPDGEVRVVALPGNEGYQFILSHSAIEDIPGGKAFTIRTDINSGRDFKIPIRANGLKQK